jgi:hypothetical protein
VIPSELKGNSKGSTVSGISVESKGLYNRAEPFKGAGCVAQRPCATRYRTGLGSQLVEIMMRDDDSRGTFTRKRRPLSANW